MKKLIVDAEIAIEPKALTKVDAATIRKRYRPSSYKNDPPPQIIRKDSPSPSPPKKGSMEVSDNEESRKVKDEDFWLYISEKVLI